MMLQRTSIALLLAPCIVVTGLKLQDEIRQRAPNDAVYNEWAPPKPKSGTYDGKDMWTNPFKPNNKDRPDLVPADAAHFPDKYGGMPDWVKNAGREPPVLEKEVVEVESSSESSESSEDEASNSKAAAASEETGESMISSFARTLSNFFTGFFNGIASMFGGLFEFFTLPFAPAVHTVVNTATELSKTKEEKEAEKKAAAEAKEAAKRQAVQDEKDRIQKYIDDEIEKQRKIDEETYKNPPLWRYPKSYTPPSPAQQPSVPVAELPPPPGWQEPEVEKLSYPPYRNVQAEKTEEKKRLADMQYQAETKRDADDKWQDLPAFGGGKLGDMFPTFEEGRLHAPKAWENANND
jgi:hypothetical protein